MALPISSEDCINKISAAGNLTAREAAALLRDIADRAEKMRLSGESDPVVKAAGELSDAVKLAAKEDRLDALRNASKRNAVMKSIDVSGGISAAADVLRSLLHGTNTMSRQSIESMWHGRASRMMAVLDNSLKKIGMQKAMKDGLIDEEVATAWWKLNAGEKMGNSLPEQAAKLYQNSMNALRVALNKNGAAIAEANDYVTHTSHDPIKMRQAAGFNKSLSEGFEAWWAKTLPLLNTEKTFKDVADIKKFGRSVYEALVTGIHKQIGGKGESDFVPLSFEGTSNLARKLSQDRVLFFKDGASWNSYMKEFGTFPTLHSSVMMSLDRGYRNLALMEKLGTNPSANLNQIIRKTLEKYRDSPDLEKFRNEITGIENVMSHLDGSVNRPGNLGMARLGSAIRSWEVVSDLGAVGVTHLASIWPTVTSELAHHGINRLETMGNLVKAILSGVGDAERQGLMSDLGANSDGIVRHTRNIMGDDSIPGRISSIASRFMDFTGIHHIYDQTKAGVRAMLSHNIARNIEKAFSSLDLHLQQMLTKYGIGDSEWKQLQSVKDLPVYNGRRYMTPSAVETVDKDLADKLMSYLSDGADHAVVTPGVQARAHPLLLVGGTRPGTAVGEVARMFSQFKLWPVAAMHQVLGREIYMGLSKTDTAWNLGKLVAIGVPAGYLRMFIHDMATGHPPRDPRDPKTLLAAAAQSGGLGILGDFLFGEVSRMGAGPLATLAGPVASDFDTVIKIFNDTREGALDKADGKKSKNLWPELARFAVGKIPYANLVYLKGALDYMLWYHLYEAASPGWWERTNRKQMKDNGRAMIGYVPGGGVPTGVPGIYMKNKYGQSFGAFGSTPLGQ